MKRFEHIGIGLCLIGALGCNDSQDSGVGSLRGEPAFAVRLTDYTSAGVAILDGEGEIVSEKIISSGSATAGLTEALTGDIALPSEPCAEGMLTVIARGGGDYVLQMELESGEVAHQVKVQGKSAGAAYSANPYDALCLDDGHTALVTRFAPNLDPKADAMDLGDDVIVMDLEAGKRMRRISFEALRDTYEGRDEMGQAVEEVTYARPSSIVRVGQHAVVGLAGLSLSWEAGPAKLGLIDLDDYSLEGVALPKGFLNCGFVVKVADRDDAVVISCAGSPFGDPKTAGLLLLSVDDAGQVEVEERYHPSAEGPAPFGYIASLGGSRVFAVDDGDYTADMPDRGFIVDLATGRAKKVVQSGGAGLLGDAEYRADTGLLLVPDAGLGVRRFQVSEGEVTALDPVRLDLTLPPRGVRSLVNFR